MERARRSLGSQPKALVLGLAALVVVALALRGASTLTQSIWVDEEFTRRIVSNDLQDMLRGISETESTPGLFYLLEWAVTQLLGSSGDRILRVLPIAAGAASVPVAFLLGRSLRDNGTGVFLALLVAVHPLLVWYGAEARSYSLYVLLSLVSLLCFVWLLQESSARNVALWALAVGAMTLTHYFGMFIGAAQLVWLLAARPGLRRELALAVAGLAVVGVAGAPLWAEQDVGRASFIDYIPFAVRLKHWAHQSAVGMSTPEFPLEGFVYVGAGFAIVAALGWAVRAGRARPETIAVGAVLAMSSIAILVFAQGFFVGRNMIGLWPAAAALVAVGITSLPRRIAAVPALAILVPSLIATGAFLVDDDLQRPDFKGLADALGPPVPGQVIVISGDSSALPFGYYLDRVEQPPDAPVDAAEVIAVSADAPTSQRSCESGALCNVGRGEPLEAAPEGADLTGVEFVGRRRIGEWKVSVFRANPPVPVTRDLSNRFFANPRFPHVYASQFSP